MNEPTTASGLLRSWVGSYPDAGVRIAFISNCDGGFEGKSKLGEHTKDLRTKFEEAAFA